MFRGSRLGGQSFEPSVEGDYGSTIKLGIWNNEPINNSNKVHGQSDPEIDPYGSYTYAINDSLSLQPGFTWYNYPDAPKSAGLLQVDVRAEPGAELHLPRCHHQPDASTMT